MLIVILYLIIGFIFSSWFCAKSNRIDVDLISIMMVFVFFTWPIWVPFSAKYVFQSIKDRT